jgi:hypothetical protein
MEKKRRYDDAHVCEALTLNEVRDAYPIRIVPLTIGFSPLMRLRHGKSLQSTCLS